MTKDGYVPWRQQVELKQPDQVVSVVLQRLRLPITLSPSTAPSTGVFNVTGLPSDARFCVYVENEWQCDVNQQLPTGREYTLFASAPGYQDWRGRAYLDADNPVVRVSLVAEQSRSGYEPEMVLIKGGCYQMGSPENEAGRKDNERQHRVCVEDVYAATTETTVSQFKAFIDCLLYTSPSPRD